MTIHFIEEIDLLEHKHFRVRKIFEVNIPIKSCEKYSYNDNYSNNTVCLIVFSGVMREPQTFQTHISSDVDTLHTGAYWQTNSMWSLPTILGT